MQDRQGFTWIGTDDGLNRYDGQRFEIFRHSPDNSSSISGNIITDVLEDSSGVIWISSADGGITRFDHKARPSERFRLYRHSPTDTSSIPVNTVNAMLFDRRGYLWLATSGASLVRFDTQTAEFLPAEPGSKRTCTDVCMDGKGMIWSGRQGGSYMIIDPVTLRVTNDDRYLNPYRKLPHVTVTTLYKDNRDNIWFGSWDNAVYKYSASTSEEEVWADHENNPGLGKDEATAFTEDNSGNLWIGTKKSGLLLLDLQSNKFYRNQHSSSREGTVASNTINCLYRDRNNNIWVGTDKGVSVSMSGNRNFMQVFLPALPGAYSGSVVNDFTTGADGKLWIATSDGVFIREGEQFSHFPIKYGGKAVNVTRFFKDQHGNMYLGADYSLFTFDPVNMRFELLPNTAEDVVMNRIIASRVVSMAEDSVNGRPALVVSPYGHFITYYDLVNKRWISRADSLNRIISRFDLRDNLVKKIYKDPSGRLWLGTAKAGLAAWDRKTHRFRYYMNDPADPGSISNNHVGDMESDAGGKIWLSTFGGGLNCFTPATGRFDHITTSANLLEGLAIDKSGKIWMIGNGTVHRYDPVLKSFMSFNVPDMEKSGGLKGDLYRDEEGWLYGGGLGFYIRFHPDSVTLHREQPEVLLTNLLVYDSSYSERLYKETKVKLKHDENFFSIHYSAPWYEGKVYYQYMLEGLDQKWIDAGDQTIAPYTHLNGGHYTFRVRASTVPGIWSGRQTVLDIYIVPPFWTTWWFYTILVACLAAIMYGIYRYRINELVKRQGIRNRIAQDLHDNMGSTLSSISVYSQVAKIYKEQHKQHELDETLEKISVTSGEMISEMNDIVWAINPRNDHMEKIIQRMESFARPLMKASGIGFRLDYDESVLRLNLGMEKRKNFYLIFKEAVTNALKYAECSEVAVDITLRQEKVDLKISDNGKGFDPAAVFQTHEHTLSGNGLRNMQMRAKEMGATFALDAAPGRGTSVSLRFGLP
jgi:ligand-binding sensor domain-containing protein/anti-sigma regulatory factor (Ser/Thr protein kinase)